MLCVFLCFAMAEARIWAWMLNMPHSPPKEGAKALKENTSGIKPVTVRNNKILCIKKIYIVMINTAKNEI